MNKQPYYHRATLLFTATEPLDVEQLTSMLLLAVTRLARPSRRTVLPSSIVIEEVSSEPGDPADLVG